MNRERLADSLRAALIPGAAPDLLALVRDHHPADVAALLGDFSDPEAAGLLLRLPEAERADLFGYVPLERQLAVIARLGRRDVAALFSVMDADERADLFNRLGEDEQQALLPALAQAEREDIRKLASYDEGTVGAIMTSDYVTLTAGLTPPEAIEQLRRVAPDAETIYQAYVVDADRRLVGTVSLRDLIVAPARASVGELMNHEPIFIRADEAREAAAQLIDKYDLIALPVINGGDRLVGIVTYDDALDVVQEEATEDFHKGGGNLSLRGLSIVDASTWQLYRKRIFWLLLLVFGNLLSGAGIAFFEDTIAAYIALVFFLPLLIGSGGNAGSQAATLMVRALAVGDVQPRDWGRMLGREFAVATLMGCTMAFAVSSIGFLRGGPDIALVVSVSMVAIVIVGSTLGMSLPFVLSRLRLDPATASAPLVTTIADAAGVVIYLSVAVLVLGGPPPA